MQGNEIKVNSGVPCPKCGLRLDAGVPVCPNDGTRVGAGFDEGALFENKYLFLERIAEGGMGVIFKAKQQGLDRIIAIKMLHMATATPTTVRRFQQEAQALARLDHPNLVKVHELGVTDYSQPYTVMEFVDGEGLDTMLKERGRLSVAKVLVIFDQVCNGLEYVHKQGILHRDLKPSNIMLINPYGETPRVKLVDFGIAKIIDSNVAKALTQTGEVFGSPLYMSPEQAKGIVVDQRSDIYSLGCVMYELLTGRTPFAGETLVEIILKQVGDKPQSLNSVIYRGEKIPNSIEAIVLKMLEKNPADRFQSVGALHAELTKAMAAHRSWYHIELPSVRALANLGNKGSMTILYASIGVLLVAAIAVISFLVLQPDKPNRPLRDTYVDVHKGGAKAHFEAADLSNIDPSAFTQLLPTGEDKDQLSEKAIREKDSRIGYTQSLDCKNLTVLGSRNMPYISKLPLNSLSMFSSRRERVARFTGADLEYVGKIKTLQHLELEGVKVTAKNLEYLLQLPRLTSLTLNSCGLNDDCMSVLGRMPNLHELMLHGNPQITSKGLAHIASLPIYRLGLQNSGIDDKAAPYFARMKGLNWLVLSYTHMGDQTFEAMEKIPDLRLLDVSQTSVSSKAFTDAKFPKLMNLVYTLQQGMQQPEWSETFGANNPNCIVKYTKDQE